jgi:phage tail-like protein
MANQKRPPSRGVGTDPYLSFRFKVEIDSLQVSGFNEVSGLTAETDVESFREGGLNAYERQLASPTKFPSKLILKRGLAAEEPLWDWYKKVMKGNIERKQVTVVLQDPAGDEKYRWAFQKACPVKWSGPDFRAGTAEVAFESIELVHEGLVPGAKSGRSQK